MGGAMLPEVFFGWMAMMAAVFDPMRKLSKVVLVFQRADAAAARVFELQDREQEVSLTGAINLPPHTESIEFRGVSYTYPGAAEPAVRNVDLTVKAGQAVAVVGPNGCGKTTLVSLLPKLLQPTAGEVLIDGQDIALCTFRSVRRQTAVVTQQSVLFNATIGENIAYGARHATEEAVRAAAKQAYVDEFVSSLPDGYKTMVGEEGATLSGGERQRICIARAILRNPPILIFDEATSQIDADSEQRIHEALKEFTKDRTTLMIAHRFSTILEADMIVVMDRGAVVDTGTHPELLERCELYGQLYRTQFAGA